MARRIQVVIDDDLTGGTADETVTFGLDGVTYEIDLTASNADRLRDLLRPYIDSGRKVTGARRRSGAAAGNRNKAGEIRAWAQANGVPVNPRGRVAADVVARYEAAHA